VLQSPCNVHVLPFFVNEHDPLSIGISARVSDREPILGAFVPDRFVVVPAVDAVAVVFVVVVVDAGLVDVVEADETVVDDGDPVLAVIARVALAGSTITAVFDVRAAAARTAPMNTGSTRIGTAARTVAMRRLIEPRFGRARRLIPSPRAPYA
jgi:hypothetical protein